MSVPVVHTRHAPFNTETRPFYTRHTYKVRLVALSRVQLGHAPAGVRVAEVVANPIRVEDWPLGERKDDYLLWMGRVEPELNDTLGGDGRGVQRRAGW